MVDADSTRHLIAVHLIAERQRAGCQRAAIGRVRRSNRGTGQRQGVDRVIARYRGVTCEGVVACIRSAQRGRGRLRVRPSIQIVTAAQIRSGMVDADRARHLIVAHLVAERQRTGCHRAAISRVRRSNRGTRQRQFIYKQRPRGIIQSIAQLPHGPGCGQSVRSCGEFAGSRDNAIIRNRCLRTQRLQSGVSIVSTGH